MGKDYVIAAVPLESSGVAVPPVVYASWGRRLTALTLDYLIVSIPIVLILEAVSSSSDAAGWILVFGWPAILLFFGTYFVGFHGGKRGQTPGKMVLGIAVRDDKMFMRIGYPKALGRLLATTLLWCFFWIPGIVDALRPLWDGRNQSLHDKIAGTVVVRV